MWCRPLWRDAARTAAGHLQPGWRPGPPGLFAITDLDHVQLLLATDLRIPLGDAPVPAYPGQPCTRRLGLIRLSVAETARLARLAADWAPGLFTRAGPATGRPPGCAT